MNLSFTRALATQGVLVVFLLSVVTASVCPMGEPLQVKNPSFIEIFPRQDTSDATDTLWITEFTGNPFAKGKVQFVENYLQYSSSNFSNMPLTLLYDSFAWPNKISKVPAAAGLPKSNLVVVPDGFLVPGKSNGGIYLVDTDAAVNGSVNPLRVDSAPKGWFYHMVLWKDMDCDGRMDILTARATKPLFGSGRGELLWLKQPSSGQLDGKWEEHVLTSGPDVLFTVNELDNKTFQVIAPQFFSKVLMAYTFQECSATLLGQPRVIDPQSGPGYVATLIDMDMDGVPDLLYNNHEGGNGGQIIVYKGPDFNNKTVIVENAFKVTVSGFNSAAPGFVYPFMHPESSGSSPPSLLVAGDDAGAFYVFNPEAPLKYTETFKHVVGGTVGTIGLASDTPKYFFVPWYEKGLLYPYTFC